MMTRSALSVPVTGLLIAAIAGGAGWIPRALAQGLGQGVPPLSQEERNAPLPTPEIKPRGIEPKGLDPAPKRSPGPATPAPEARPDASPAPKALPKGTPPSRSARPTEPGKEPKGLAVQQPRTPKEREKALADLYAQLATSETPEKSAALSRTIERLWLSSGSDTVNLLMHRAMEAVQAKKPDLAMKLLDAAVDLSPDYAEAWNRRAYVNFLENNYDRALGDLRRVLALDSNHFKALDGLMNILREIGRKKDALAVARQLLDVHPHQEGLKGVVEQLTREVEGRGI